MHLLSTEEDLLDLLYSSTSRMGEQWLPGSNPWGSVAQAARHGYFKKEVPGSSPTRPLLKSGSRGSLVRHILGGQWHRRQDIGTSRRRSPVQVWLIHCIVYPGMILKIKNHPTLMGQDTRDWHCQWVSHQSSPCQSLANNDKTAQIMGGARAWAMAHKVWPVGGIQECSA